MTASNVVPLAILFIAMHVSLTVIPASCTKAKGGTPPAASSSAYRAGQRAVDRCLARVKETIGLLTRTKADLSNNRPAVVALGYCIQFSETDARHLKTVRSELAKGKGRVGTKEAATMVLHLSSAAEYAYICLDELYDAKFSHPRLGVVIDQLSWNESVFEATVRMVARAFNLTVPVPT